MNATWKSVLVVVASFVSLSAWGGEIEPRLQAVMDAASPDSLIPVVFVLSNQLSADQLHLDGLSRSERRAVLANELRSHAAATQGPILQAMMSVGGGLLLKDINSAWLTNAVYSRANPAAIVMFGSRADVARALLNGISEIPDDVEHERLNSAEQTPDSVISPEYHNYLTSLRSDSLVSVIIYLKDRVPVAALDAELRAQRATLVARHERVIRALKEKATSSQGPLLMELGDGQRSGKVRGYTPYWIANLIVAQLTVEKVFELASRVDVLGIEPNFRIFMIESEEPRVGGGESSASLSSSSTSGLTAINAPRVWDELGITGAGRLVAGIDSGVMGNHPALQSRWRGAQPGVPWQHAWKDLLGTGTQFPTDTNGHGTHTMGTMAGGTTSAGLHIGVAWGAKWIACNPITGGSGGPQLENNVIAAFQWVADPDGNPQTTSDVPDVVNNSWGVFESHGYNDCFSLWWAVIDACEAAGCAVVFSAGNEGPTPKSLRSPADRITTPINSYAVGAVDGRQAPYIVSNSSSRGPSGCDNVTKKPELVAPGVQVFSSYNNGGYITDSGTSMAGPHVAGIFALLREADPNLDVATMKQIIINTANDLGTAGEDNDYGWGIPDAYAAVYYALNPGCYPSPNPPCDPPCWRCDLPTSLPQCGVNPPSTSWAINWINADDVWNLGYKGDGVVLGQIDNGFEYSHVDLDVNHLYNYRDSSFNQTDDDQNGYKDDYLGYDFTAGSTPPGFPPNQDPDPYEERQIEPYCDSQRGGTGGHGTATLSVAVGAGLGDEHSQQVTGVAPNAWFVPIKSGDPSYVRTSSCCQGVTYSGGPWATISAMQYAVVRDVDILLIQSQENENSMFDFRTNADLLLAGSLLAVAPTGSYGPGEVGGPGFVPSPWMHPHQRDIEQLGKPSGVLSVGALSFCLNERQESSGHGPVIWNLDPPFNDYAGVGLIKPDIMGPGQLNLSAAASNSCLALQGSGQPGQPQQVIYGVTGGTSGAAAAVAGAALLMLSKDNDLTPVELDSLLQTTTPTYSPSTKNESTGSGTVDALAAINATEFFNHFDRMLNGNPPANGTERDAEQTHWKPHLDAGTPIGQWDFEDTNGDPNITDGVLEGEAPLSKQSLTTVHHDRQSYRMDFEFEIKSFPTGGGHLTPFFGAVLRYDPPTAKGVYLQSLKENGQTRVELKREQTGDPVGGIVLATVPLSWNWAIDTPYAWHVWDDGTTVSLIVDRPGLPGTVVLDHAQYASSTPGPRKGFLVKDGTRIQFDNVRIEGFQGANPLVSPVVSRYMGFDPGVGQSIGGCPANFDPVRHPGGIEQSILHAGDYWIDVIVRDTAGRPIQGYWDIQVDFTGCGGINYPHPGMPASKRIYADSPTDAAGHTVVRKALAFGGKDPCGFAVKAGGQTLKAFPNESQPPHYGGLRNIDLNGNGAVALDDLSQWQVAFTNNGPKYVCDLNFDAACALGDLSIWQRHFIEHQNGSGIRENPPSESIAKKSDELTAKGKMSGDSAAVGERTELYLTVMDRLPPGVPMPPVTAQNAVTAVGNVGPGGRDVTVGLYANGFDGLAGAHMRCRWPIGWELVTVRDSLVLTLPPLSGPV